MTKTRSSRTSLLDRESSPDLPELIDVMRSAQAEKQDSEYEDVSQEEIDQLISDPEEIVLKPQVRKNKRTRNASTQNTRAALHHDELASDDDGLQHAPAKKAKASTATTQQKNVGKQARKSKKEVEEEETIADPRWKKIVLIIPSVDGPNERKTLEDGTEVGFETFLDAAYDAIGCDNVPRKPKLSYKLEGAATRAPATRLGSDEDWEGCIDEVVRMQRKKRDTIKVLISVPEDYMDSLKKKQDKKKGTKTKTKTNGKGSKKPATLNLDVLSSDELDEDDADTIDSDDENAGASLQSQEKKWVKKLMSYYGSCTDKKAKCPPGKACKVDKHSRHVILTIGQLQAWANALSLKMPGVTEDLPPKTQMFEMFHHSMYDPSLSTAPSPAPAPAPQANVLMSSFLGAFAANLTNRTFPVPTTPMLGAPPISATPVHVTPMAPQASVSEPDIPSSDGFDEFRPNPYPTIASFFPDLDEAAPQHHLVDFIERFESEDYYHIDELLECSPSFFTGPKIRMTSGNASWMISQVRKKIEKVDRQLKKQKQQRVEGNAEDTFFWH
ncbi:hypothetical protein K435DRAFT_851066 [Dendrothele bispora CBS 962.96]|uniref:Uncharacterized protein n=1 Tax=Dendrothele bispora (strain CBS 962.96) TaxID=1314807 RepID=A0A4S8MPM7_DENBC|nr:hypothetical protein K435DRAFT_851066 [Dendrothele bispora CBS 962.96]